MMAASRIVAAELTVNGGGSLLDKVNQIGRNHEDAKEHWSKLELGQEQFDGTQRKILIRLTSLETEAQKHWSNLEEANVVIASNLEKVRKES